MNTQRKEGKEMKIGIIGAGRMAQSIGLLAARAGHQVMLSNSRGPDTIRHIGQQIDCEVGTVDDVAEFGEMIVAAIHLQISPAIPTKPLAGKIVLNPQNYFAHLVRYHNWRTANSQPLRCWQGFFRTPRW